MIKKRSFKEGSITEMVWESLQGLSKVKDVSQSIDEFNKLQYPAPKHYGPKDVRRIRKKLRVSQAVLAYLLNTKLTTVQKWERGVNEPNGPASRLLQLLDHKGPKPLLL